MNSDNNQAPVTTRFAVSGMHCASCAFVIRDALRKAPGVLDAQVNFASETASVLTDQGGADVRGLNERINKYGYSLMLADPQAMKDQPMSHKVGSSLPVLVLFTVSAIAFAVMVWSTITSATRLPSLPVPMDILDTLYAMIGLLVYSTVGRRFVVALYRLVRYRIANMDTLVGLGTITAYVYSVVLMLIPAWRVQLGMGVKLYFDTVMIVLGFILFGDYLVARSKQKTGEALHRLMGLQVKSASVLRDGKEINIPVEEIVVGDIFIVRPGEKVATDGKIIDGITALDESMVTGESMPVDKGVGDIVIGSTVNTLGSIRVEAMKVGDETLLAQIIGMVAQAQDSRAPIQDLVDRVTTVFVPFVLAVGVIALTVWALAGRLDLGINALIAVLIVACPCAMGLATPIAVIVGVGKAAESGILIKDADNLQKLAAVDYVVFDKTGTITTGRPEVVEISMDERAFAILASLAHKSEHPIARAIASRAQTDGVTMHEVSDFAAVPGKGMSGVVDGIRYHAGSVRLAQELLSGERLAYLGRLQSVAGTSIVLVTSSDIVGHVVVADAIRSASAQTIATLHTMGIQVALLSGDQRSVVQTIADEAGIKEVYSEVLPADKEQIIRKLQSQGKTVAMVGDGINDAPALAVADVGIAMGSGTDVAIASAGVTLLGSSIEKVRDAIIIGRASMRTIRQNLFWAFIYNTIGIPIAAGALYPIFRLMLTPAIEGAAMAFSSISVVLNSLRLKYASLKS